MAVPFRRAGSFAWAAPLASKVYGINCRLKQIYPNLYTKGAAQAKTSLNGKAQPFLTTGGEAVTKRKILLRIQEVARLLHRVYVTQSSKLKAQSSKYRLNQLTAHKKAGSLFQPPARVSQQNPVGVT